MPTYEDIAFKVIVKNDGISDIIFKTLMLKGEAGGTISSIEKTSSVGVVDTYTITLNDGTTTTFEVTNGSNIASIEKTATAGLIDTYTVTLTNGDTSTFEVKNGEDAQLYELPKDCVVGYDKEPTQVTETFVDRYIMLNNVNGISSVKYNGSTLQETNDGRNLFDISQISSGSVTGVDYDVDVDTGTITVSGQATGSGWKSILNFTLPETGTYHFHLEKTGNVGYFLEGFASLGSDATVVCNDITTIYRLAISAFTTGETYEGTISKIQVEKGSTATLYQPYCGGIPAPNPDYPREIVGVGEKQQDNTYSVDLVAEDSDGNVYTVTASGLSHPVYAGDWIDLVAGKLYRYNGVHTFDGSENWIKSSSYSGGYYINYWAEANSISYSSNHFQDKLITVSSVSEYGNNINVCLFDRSLNFRVDNDLCPTVEDFKAFLSNNPITVVYPLATATEEDITLTGDLEQVKRIRGEYAYIDAPLYASTEITFGQETDFPDGYEEIDFPLDDLFYYQDQEYIEFPTSWGFVMGYVFDASEIRFTMNVTKDLKQGFNVVANKSVDLALNLYTGAGGSNLTGFNFVDASFIREYGQIQIRLKTENPHGLTVGSLLGARVSQGRLRITFEAPQEE